MSVSALFGSRLVVQPPSAAVTRAAPQPRRLPVGSGGGYGLVIECSSRPQKKSTQHHMKTCPRKTRPSDIKRRPTVYPPLPPLPPEWSFASTASTATPVAEATPVPENSE
ncbi:50S ribosomal protein 6- chloroplastic [Striga hermonthica]|uniref:50S ribosomal protein 6- chloroplastic n=1 Tax=Striga hermonthica TaxID=68872 RepID=A0A9N7R0T2_STRHE|nr:50S ribosomal protein 6- chloroplastic [Striga hermonthica]